MGGLVAIVALALIAFFYLRWRHSAISRERPVNVFQDDEYDKGLPQVLPRYYTSEPFVVPDPTNGGTSEVASSRDRPLSLAADTPWDIPYPQTLAPVVMTAATKTTEKTDPPAQLPPVNIIQYNEAGPSVGPTRVGEPETTDLPPAYANIGSSV
jgi:hypothetical protein